MKPELLLLERIQDVAMTEVHDRICEVPGLEYLEPQRFELETLLTFFCVLTPPCRAEEHSTVKHTPGKMALRKTTEPAKLILQRAPSSSSQSWRIPSGSSSKDDDPHPDKLLDSITIDLLRLDNTGRPDGGKLPAELWRVKRWAERPP